ncbi:MAG: hypothetical protein KA508_02165 [Gammaproteobacteria bacterium]|nr:hypothetical protein [Gammaproteobacteria bacterium]
MFCVYNEKSNSPLNQAQTEAFNAFCEALSEYSLSAVDRLYYLSGGAGYVIVCQSIVTNLQATFDAIDPIILNKISTLDESNPLKLQLQKSLMVLTEFFSKLELARRNALRTSGGEEQEAINKRQRQAMTYMFSSLAAFSQLKCLSVGVKAFESLPLNSIGLKTSNDKLVKTVKGLFSSAFSSFDGGGMPSGVPSLLQAEVQQHVSVLGSQLELVKVDGDGDCLYRAVALYLGEDVQFLRNMVAANLAHNIDAYRAFITLPQGRTIEDYIADIRNSNAWAGDLEISILVRLLGRPIISIGPDGQMVNRQVLELESEEPIFVYYNNVNHYDGLVLQSGYTGQAILEILLQEIQSKMSRILDEIPTLIESNTSDLKRLVELTTVARLSVPTSDISEKFTTKFTTAGLELAETQPQPQIDHLSAALAVSPPRRRPPIVLAPETPESVSPFRRHPLLPLFVTGDQCQTDHSGMAVLPAPLQSPPMLPLQSDFVLRSLVTPTAAGLEKAQRTPSRGVKRSHSNDQEQEDMNVDSPNRPHTSNRTRKK